MIKRNLSPVPQSVVDNVVKYFSENLPAYAVNTVVRASDHPEDHYLYMVISRKTDGTYAVHTSWNESLQSLNNGHYGLPDIVAAMEVIVNNYNRI